MKHKLISSSNVLFKQIEEKAYKFSLKLNKPQGLYNFVELPNTLPYYDFFKQLNITHICVMDSGEYNTMLFMIETEMVLTSFNGQ